MARKRLLAAVAVLLVASPLAGCLGAASSTSADCYATRLVTASWEDPGAAEAIAGVEEAETFSPAGGFDVSVPEWNHAYGDYAVDLVTWNVSSETDEVPYQGMNRLNLRPNGLVTLQVPAHVSDETVEDLLETFAHAVTEAEDRTIQRWTEGFLASREDHPQPGEGSSGFRTAIEGPFALDGLVEDLAEDEPKPLGVAGMGIVEHGDWTASLTVPSDRVDNGRSAEEFWTLSGDAFGRVVVELPNVDEDPQAVAQRVDEVYEHLEIDAEPPDPDAVTLDTACVPA